MYNKIVFGGIFSYRVLDIYKIMFIKHFGIKQGKELKYFDYDNMIYLITEEYKRKIGQDKEKLFLEKIRVMDAIERATATDISALALSFLAMFVSIITSLSAQLTQEYKLKIANIIMYFVCGGFFIVCFKKIGDSIFIKNIKGYNKICLEILKRIEKEM